MRSLIPLSRVSRVHVAFGFHVVQFSKENLVHLYPSMRLMQVMSYLSPAGSTTTTPIQKTAWDMSVLLLEKEQSSMRQIEGRMLSKVPSRALSAKPSFEVQDGIFKKTSSYLPLKLLPIEKSRLPTIFDGLFFSRFRSDSSSKSLDFASGLFFIPRPTYLVSTPETIPKYPYGVLPLWYLTHIARQKSESETDAKSWSLRRRGSGQTSPSLRDELGQGGRGEMC